MCSAHNREILRGRFWFGCYCTCRLPRGGKVPWEGFTPHTLSAHLLLLESPRRFCHQCSADLASFTHCSLLNCNLSSLDPAFVFVSLLSQISSADFEKSHLQPIFRPAYKTPQTLPPLSSSLQMQASSTSTITSFIDISSITTSSSIIIIIPSSNFQNVHTGDITTSR